MVKTRKIISVLAFFIIVAAIAAAIPGKAVQAAPKRLADITAVYTGDTLRVGEAIKMDKLTVMGMYSDGSYEKVKNFSLSSYTVTRDGVNEIEIYSEGIKSTFTVMGKKAMFIDAYYETNSATIGEQLVRDKITVTAYYTDGSVEKVSDYTLSHTIVANLGKNEFKVTYEDVSITFIVEGKKEKKPESLYAMYSGSPVIVGNAPKREDFYVSVLYNDGSMEQITSFELSPSIVQKEGKNTMAVSFAGLSQEVSVTGLAKTVVSIEAEYTGLPIVIGKSVAKEDIKVTATFNDGSKDTVTGFSLSGSVIYNIGDNLITVYCDNATAHITVRGVEAEIIDYENSAYTIIRDNGLTSQIRLAVGGKADPKGVRIEKVSVQSVEKAMRRSVKSDKYMAFEVIFDDPELDSYLPMTMKVTVPDEIDQEMFGVFYTPNKKTIMAQMNGEFLADGTYEFKMFQPGTYIIADCTPQLFIQSIRFEEEEINLRLGRSYSLDPEITPHMATDKTLTYKSSKPHVVSVSEYGKIKGLKTGSAIITVEARDGSGKKAKIRVNVVEKKGEFDAEIADLSDMALEVETAEEYLAFLDYIVYEIEDKSYELEEHEFILYMREVEDWIDSWDEDTFNLPEEEWEYVFLLMLEYAAEDEEYFAAFKEDFFERMLDEFGAEEDYEEMKAAWEALFEELEGAGDEEEEQEEEL